MSVSACPDRIHFLNTGHSDCIILESGGRFAMVDAAEDTDYPPDKPSLNLPGYEDVVVDYLLSHCKGADGRVHLDFVLGTHAHSDHIGGFDTVIDHPLIDVDRAYLKRYDPKTIFIGEVRHWDNWEVYTQMLDACRRNEVKVVQNMDDTPFMLGNFRITLLNTAYKKRRFKFGENINSVVMLLEKAGTRVLLVGDLNYKDGDERTVADRVGRVDLLKVGHHGYVGSTSFYLAKTLAPHWAVITNTYKGVYPDVRLKLKKVAKAEVLCTADLNGILASVGPNGKIEFQTNIMSGETHA